jgi:hypothetical protein
MEMLDLRVALARLPDNQLEALLLVGAAGHSYVEVAEICGCAIGTIKSRVNRARKSLAGMLCIEPVPDMCEAPNVPVTKGRGGGGAMRRCVAMIGANMMRAIVALAVSSFSIQGAVHGADERYRVAGPIGALFRDAVGGGVGSLFGVDRRQRFLDYAAKQHHDSYAFDRQVEVGAVLSEQGVTFYEIPPDYNARGYKYTIVNGRTVIVDPQSRSIVLIVD